MPCGHTLASVCPPCAERAKALRTAQCREGWHLDNEPVTDTGDPDDYQRWLIETRAETQAKRDHATADREDTAELDALNGELDEEITRAGMRGNVLPARPVRRHRSTRRRQDAPELPRRAVAARTVGKTYTAPDGTTFRPSMFVTLTCPSYGRVGSDGTPADPAATTTAGPPATRCTSRRCSTGSSRTFAGSSAMTCSISPPSNPSGGWPRTSTSRCAAPCPALSCARCSPRPITRSGGQTPRQSATETASRRCGTRPAATTSTPQPGKYCPPGMRHSTRSATRRPAAARRPVRRAVRRPGRAGRITRCQPVHRLPHQIPDQARRRLPRPRHRRPARPH